LSCNAFAIARFLVLRYSTEFGRFGANYIGEFEVRSLLSATKMYSPKNLV